MELLALHVVSREHLDVGDVGGIPSGVGSCLENPQRAGDLLKKAINLVLFVALSELGGREPHVVHVIARQDRHVSWSSLRLCGGRCGGEV